MGSTVYLNHHFKPKNQTSYYQNKMTDYFTQQEEINELIFTKLNNQQAFMYKQYHHLLQYILKNDKEFEESREELAKLGSLMQQNSHFYKDILLQLAHKLEQVDETIMQNKESFEFLTNNHQLLITEIQEIRNQFHQFKKEQNEIVNNTLSELTQTEEKLGKDIIDLMGGKLNEIQNNIVQSILTDFEKVNDKLNAYIKERTRQPMCEFFKDLNPGTKMNSIAVSGVEVQIASFINYERMTKQVKFITKDGNLFIANCSNIEAVELRTRKQDDSK